MFNNLLLESLKNRVSEFEGVKFSLNDSIFETSSYDMINSCILANAIIDEKEDNTVLFHSHGTIFLMYAVAIAAFVALERDATNEENSLERNLKVGDRIKYKGCLAIYDGIYTMDGKKQAKILCGGKHKDVIYAPVPEGFMQIQKYWGTATKMKGFRLKKDRTQARQALLGILKLDSAQLNIIRTSHVVVITEKRNFIDSIVQLKVNDHRFTNLFPTARLPNPERHVMLAGSKSSDMPVIFILSNLNTLYEYVQKGHKINSLIIDGVSKIKNNYGTLEAIKQSKCIENIMIYLDHRFLAEGQDFEKMNFRKWVWLKQDMAELKELVYWNSPKEHPTDPFSSHYKTLRYLSKQKCEFIDVDFPRADTWATIKDAMKILKKIKRYNDKANNPQINEFLVACYGTLLYFQHLPFPVELCDKAVVEPGIKYFDYKESLERINITAQDLLSRSMPPEFNADFEKLLSNIRLISEHFVNGNRKPKALTTHLKDNKENTLIVVRKPWYIYFLQKWLDKNNIKNTTVIDFKAFRKINENVYFDKVVFTGWFGEENKYIFNSGISPLIVFLSYPSEKSIIATYISELDGNAFDLRNAKNRALLLGIDENSFSVKPAEVKKREEKPPEFYEDVTKIVSDLSFAVFSETAKSYAYDAKDSINARHVIFEEELHAFLSVGYRAKVLNRLEAKIEQKNIEELNSGDEIVFVRDSKKDIFEELVNIVEAQPSFSNEVKLSKLWRVAIKEYMSAHAMWHSNLLEKLERAGCGRHSATIENWIKDEHTIAPGDENKVITAIAELTLNNELMSKLKEVIYSCRKLRALHIRLGRYLAECIVASMYPQGESKIEGFLKDKIKELSQHILIIEVKSISDSLIAVGKTKVNRVLEVGE
ncbi:MAG: DrmE family protein [Candidatus Omnitrophica bacterium]|nr:DrmE family protein [Candidatus Omnitrophota bacterium]